MVIFFAEQCSYFASARVKFLNFFFNYFANCPLLTNTVIGCIKVISFYSGKLSKVLCKRKNTSVTLPAEVSSGTISALTGIKA
jgi:hypothetical protein